MITGAQECDERRACLFWAQGHVSMTLKDCLYPFSPCRWTYDLHLVVAGMEQVAALGDGSDLDVAVEAWGDACVDRRACCTEHGGGLVGSRRAEIEFIGTIWLTL
eukprot:2278097-Prymnesium_polylepis.1